MTYFNRFVSDKIKARIDEVRDAIVRDRRPLNLRMARTASPEWRQEDFDDRDWQVLEPGASFQAIQETIFLRSAFEVPREWRGLRAAAGLAVMRTPLADGKLAGDEAGFAEALWYLNGSVLQASDRYHQEMWLSPSASDGRRLVLAGDLYIGLARMSVRRVKDEDTQPALITIPTCELRGIDPHAHSLYYDMSVAFHCAQTMPKSSRIYATVISILDEITDMLDFRAGRDVPFYESVARAAQHLRQNLYERYKGDPAFSPVLYGIGHAHIDNAWLWRIEHTRKKCERTFGTALRYIKDYPYYKFTCSQSVQYQYLKEDNPALYQGVCEAVADGRWEPIGGMWVEADCNIPSGESLARQLLYGMRFFKHEFGRKSAVAWLPDVFGFSAALPQILHEAGIEFFVTTKLSWNQVNRSPYHTFLWEGIDGSKILSHAAPEGDYNSTMEPELLAKAWELFEQRYLTHAALYIYGHGDGGGGPSREMLERGERLQTFPGMPQLKFSSAEDFFSDLKRGLRDYQELPTWTGELYLEIHRGTYTTQAWIKRANRFAEFALMCAEQLAVLGELQLGAPYDRGRFERAWKLLLVNQFHDVVTGSSIRQVYRDTRRDFEELSSTLSDISQSSLDRLSEQVSGAPGTALIYNPLPWTRSDIVKAPADAPLAGQPVTDLDGNERKLVRLPDLPPAGYQVVADIDQDPVSDLKADTHHLENSRLRIELDGHGELRSVFDKRYGRELIAQDSYCKGNAFLAFEDKPLKHDAWDIDVFYREKVECVNSLGSIALVEDGPLRAAVEITRTFGRGSIIRQRICLYNGSARIDFETQVDWHERQTLLKVAFPVNVHSRHAAYDIQFGAIDRPTHWNTSWDWARFEVYGHKWADLSEADYGVSILNDCKYGWDIKENVLRLTLLRAPVQPDPEADQGRHYFTYSLYPHAGSWREGGTVQRAYELNVPPLFSALKGGGAMPPSFSLIWCDAPNIVVETVKKAEDGEQIIMRLFEAYGQRGRCRLYFGLRAERIDRVNLLEESMPVSAGDLAPDGYSLSMDYRPFEIKTLRVSFSRPTC